MARPLRIEYEGAWYHVMNRGQAHIPIFLNDHHRQIFLDLLWDVHQRFGAEIHAYCLMENHYHLIIRTPLGNISRIMRHVDGVYTQRFNKNVKRDGALFRGRFKAILIEVDIYLLRLNRYIHLNPVKANLANKPENFQWSSYAAYLSGHAPAWLNMQDTLKYFDHKLQKYEYKAFIDEGIDEEIDHFYKKLKNVPILGTESFIRKITERHVREEHKINEIPEHKFLIEVNKIKINLQEVVVSVASFYNLTPEELYGSKNLRNKSMCDKPKLIAMYLAVTVAQCTLSQISRHLNGITISGISRACKRLQEKMHDDENLKKEIESVREFVIRMSNVKT
jgi:putative transposase